MRFWEEEERKELVKKKKNDDEDGEVEERGRGRKRERSKICAFEKDLFEASYSFNKKHVCIVFITFLLFVMGTLMNMIGILCLIFTKRVFMWFKIQKYAIAGSIVSVGIIVVGLIHCTPFVFALFVRILRIVNGVMGREQKFPNETKWITCCNGLFGLDIKKYLRCREVKVICEFIARLAILKDYQIDAMFFNENPIFFTLFNRAIEEGNLSVLRLMLYLKYSFGSADVRRLLENCYKNVKLPISISVLRLLVETDSETVRREISAEDFHEAMKIGNGDLAEIMMSANSFLVPSGFDIMQSIMCTRNMRLAKVLIDRLGNVSKILSFSVISKIDKAENRLKFARLFMEHKVVIQKEDVVEISEAFQNDKMLISELNNYHAKEIIKRKMDEEDENDFCENKF